MGSKPVVRKKDETYWVKRHERRYPAKPKPRWIAYHVRRQQFLTGCPKEKPNPTDPRLSDLAREWDGDIAAAPTFMKRQLTQHLAEDVKAQDVILLKVD